MASTADSLEVLNVLTKFYIFAVGFGKEERRACGYIDDDEDQAYIRKHADLWPDMQNEGSEFTCSSNTLKRVAETTFITTNRLTLMNEGTKSVTKIFHETKTSLLEVLRLSRPLARDKWRSVDWFKLKKSSNNTIVLEVSIDNDST